MRDDRIEAKWIEAFRRIFELSEVKPGEEVAILSETQSRPLNVALSELALLLMGAKPFHIVMPTPRSAAPVPVRSTGASEALQMNRTAIAALAQSDMVVDLTVEGLLHARELPDIVRPKKTRVLYVSGEHPEILERLLPSLALRERVRRGLSMLRKAKLLRVTSEAGTDLTVRVEGAPVGGAKGTSTRPGEVDHIPAGLVACFPGAGTTSGVVVLAPGDMNLTFKRIVESHVRLVIEEDHVRRIEGDGADAALLRDYYAAWGDPAAYATSHIGWGMNHEARWEALAMQGREQSNGVEQRVFAGNVLYSTGANEFAQRFTLCHFDLPMRNCTLTLDGEAVVERGRLVGELA
jgi:2,5-dihydroxypyridine 5,6-dioxygenase